MWQKLKRWARALKNDGLTLWFCCRHPGMPLLPKFFALLVVGSLTVFGTIQIQACLACNTSYICVSSLACVPAIDATSPPNATSNAASLLIAAIKANGAGAASKTWKPSGLVC